MQWNIPQNVSVAKQQLDTFDSLGISIVKLTPPVPAPVWEKLEELELAVYGELGITYPLTETFAIPDSAFIESIQKRSRSLLEQPSVKALGLFSYGVVQQKQFREAVAPFFKELQKANSADIYYTVSMGQNPSPSLLPADFAIQNIRVTPQNINALSFPDPATSLYQYSPSEELGGFLTPFKAFLDAGRKMPEPVSFFVKSDWLLTALESHPSFRTTILSLTGGSDLIFPIPEESLPEEKQSSVPVILLLIIWASLGLHYNSSPLYRKSLFRYFTAHRFFIDDIFHRHIRSPLPATILILQNSFLIGATVFAAASLLLTPMGLDALFHHYPMAALFGSSTLGLAVWGFLLSLSLAFVSLLWLYFSHKRIKSFTQIATIYAWPLQLNFIVATIGITIFASNGSPSTIAFFALLAILVQLTCFVVASFDTAKYISSRALLYFLLTSGVYTALLFALLIWGYTIQKLEDIIILATSL